MQLLQFPTREAWLDALLRDFTAAAKSRPRFHVALSGGSTPKPFYERLSQSTLPWSQIDWWLGDERWVPPDDPSSNERMIRESLGTVSKEFQSHFHSWHLSTESAEAAALYEQKLRKVIGTPCILDLALQGIGTDGHTASLFPGTEGLQEKIRLAISNIVPQLNTTRLTLTFPMLDQSRQVWFLVSGKEKKEMVDRLLSRDPSIPSSHIQAQDQRIYWLT